ncbi:MAG: hypothetical protein N3A66_07155, partial [Planctomycetota bacterium]|nr:hypothetical protein [Planctomycetota bacterium]
CELYAMLYGSGDDLVLLLPALAEERKGAVRPLAEWARMRARAGSAALFVDYAGCGESPGEFADVTWQSLLANARAALQAAYARAGRAVGCLACRLASRLALEAAAALPGMVRRLCFWDPIFDGQAWLRDLRRRSRFRGTAASVGEEGEDIDGNLFSKQLIADLENLSGPPPAPSCPLLMIAFANRDASPSLRAAAAQWGAEIQCLALPPFWQEADPPNAEALLARTSAWFAGG